MLIPPPLIALAFAGAMWLLAGAFVAPIDIPGKAWIAGGLATLGFLIDIASIMSFRRARTTVNPLNPNRTTALVTAGTYRFSRNPMYVGLALFLAGWTVWLGDPLNLLLVAGFVLTVTRLQIMPEERALAEMFGEEFAAYSARTRRWL